MLITGVAMAALVGLSLGLLGGGGSILTVPIFVYVLGFAAKQAIAMTLPVVGVTSLAGALSHWRDGNIELKVAFLFGPVTMAGAFAGARLSDLLSGAMQLAILAVVMLGAGVSMLRSRRGEQGDDAPHRRRLWLVALVGLGVGMLTGLVGVGGGFLIVPALVLLADVPMKHAVGTSLVVIAMTTMAGFVAYTDRVDFPIGFLLAFTAVAVLGSLVGARFVRRIPTATLRRGFAYFLFAMGAFILVQNRSAFALDGPPAAADDR